MGNGRIKTEQYKRSSITTNANAFASTFYFFSTHKANTENNKKSLQANAPYSADIRANLTRHINGRTEARTDNTGLAKVAGSVLRRHICG